MDLWIPLMLKSIEYATVGLWIRIMTCNRFVSLKLQQIRYILMDLNVTIIVPTHILYELYFASSLEC